MAVRQTIMNGQIVWVEDRSWKELPEIKKEIILEPGIFSRTIGFLRAMLSYILAGMPKSGDKTILSRYKICKSCPSNLYYIKTEDQLKIVPGLHKLHQQGVEIGGCRKCGCFIHNTDSFPNKLSLGNQECPLGYWKKQE